MEGKKYLQIILEAIKGHSSDVTIKRNIENADAILKAIMRLQLSLGSPVKSYYDDNAGEQHTTDLIDFLWFQGAHITTISPKSSQQNDICERHFCIILNAKRVALAHSRLSQFFWIIASLDNI